MEHLEKGISRFGELSSLHELEAGFYFGVIGSHISYILGGGRFYI